VDPRIRPSLLFREFSRTELTGSIPARFADQVARPGPASPSGPARSRSRTGFDPDTWRRIVDLLRVELVSGDHESCPAAEARAFAGRLRASVEDALGGTAPMARERPRAVSAATEPVPRRR
jgi:hypothetical protein